jgi:plastocyanin
MPRVPRALAALTAVVVLVALSGCGSDDTASVQGAGSDGSSTSPGSGSSADSSDSVTIDITVKDGAVAPAGSKVKVKAGQPVHLRIDSDVADELHVHSSPEQHVEFEAGTTDKTLTFEQPGVVDVEIHDLDKLVVQLEVR